MRWKGRRTSDNVQDRRRSRVAGRGGVGIVGLLVGGAFIYMMGGNPLPFLLQNAGTTLQQGRTSSPVISEAHDDQLKEFSSVVLADTEDVWNKIFSSKGARYIEPQMVLFRSRVQSACGVASSASGPFYCPGDSKIYLDLSFFNELDKSLGAGGDFARAYVIAHEVGHHVQNITGVNKHSRKLQARMGTADRNKVSVIVELQADCFAGMWARQTQDAKAVIDSGDLEEAFNAAAAIGDDRLQRRSGRGVNVDSFTHGTSAQRLQAFKAGYSKGSYELCAQAYALR